MIDFALSAENTRVSRDLRVNVNMSKNTKERQGTEAALVDDDHFRLVVRTSALNQGSGHQLFNS